MIRERASYVRETRFETNLDGADEKPLGELFKQFGQDASTLVKQEIALAKLEMRESVKGLAKDAGKIGAAAGLAWFGAMALLAFVILGLGDLIDNYWLSSLIVAVLLLGTAAILARSAMAHMKQNSMAPQETVQTLKEDQRWAKQEAAEFKASMKS